MIQTEVTPILISPSAALASVSVDGSRYTLFVLQVRRSVTEVAVLRVAVLPRTGSTRVSPGVLMSSV